ncbi:MAG TPA: DUF4166 domain-containing protein [Xanthobacteraceae bacterium]|nr:DUF4166 domain-containing protein [Xanthobacteraceae bacterium]
MSSTSIASEPWRRPQHSPRDASPEAPLGDLRFRALLSDRDWAALPPAVQRRFSSRLAAGETIVYAGRVVETRMSRVGWCLAQAARAIGAPLALGRDRNVAAVVAVTEEMAGGGQVWTRVYARRGGFPQVIHSAKRFAGRTGLEEQVGGGVGMALTVHVVDAALVFRSAGYFVRVLGRRIALPTWLAPGALVVTHAALGDGSFTFTLDLRHPRFGALIRQTAVFREAIS